MFGRIVRFRQILTPTLKVRRQNSLSIRFQLQKFTLDDPGQNLPPVLSVSTECGFYDLPTYLTYITTNVSSIWPIFLLDSINGAWMHLMGRTKPSSNDPIGQESESLYDDWLAWLSVTFMDARGWAKKGKKSATLTRKVLFSVIPPLVSDCQAYIRWGISAET